MENTIILFDVDGTLTEPRKVIQQDMIETLQTLSEKYIIGIVGGSDLEKQKEQLGDSIHMFNYLFSENGTVAFKNGQCFHKKNIIDFLGEEKYNFNKIYFFGDKTCLGGNDHEIFMSSDTEAYSVDSPSDTIRFVNTMFLM